MESRIVKVSIPNTRFVLERDVYDLYKVWYLIDTITGEAIAVGSPCVLRAFAKIEQEEEHES